MKVRPEDRPKLIGLTAAIGILVIYFVIVVVPKLRGNQAAAPPAQAGEAAQGAATPPAATPQAAAGVAADAAVQPAADPAVQALLYADTSAPPAHTPDPFTPPAGVANPGAHTTPGNSHGANPAGPAPAGAGGRPAPPILDPPPAVELQGIVLGSSPVAVLRVGDQMLYAHQGESLGFGLVLTRINETAVRVVYGKKQLHIDIGHSVDAAGDHRVAAGRQIEPPARNGRAQPLPPLAPEPLDRAGGGAAGMRTADPAQFAGPG